MQTASALNKTTQLFALVFTGFLAGSFYYGTLILVPAFYDVPSTVHLVYRVHLMDHNAIFMQLINALALLAPFCCSITAKHSKRIRDLSLLAGILAVTTLVVTRFGNVPVNRQIRTWDPAFPAADWLATLHRWDIFNAIRTTTGIASFVVMCVVVIFAAGKRSTEEKTISASF
jgi:uncharacterized membrane protein